MILLPVMIVIVVVVVVVVVVVIVLADDLNFNSSKEDNTLNIGNATGDYVYPRSLQLLHLHRDSSKVSSRTALSYSYPFYFSRLAFGGVPEYVECEDRLNPFNEVCRNLKGCVTSGST